MQITERSKSSDEYRYGFQGQEKDNEIKGEGNSLNYTFRMHDPRVGRFFAVDPLAREYPHNSSYAFSENKVIQFIELEGLEVYLSKAQRLEYGKGMHIVEAPATFVSNSAISVYNGFIDIWNYSAKIDEAMIKKGGSQFSINSAGSEVIKQDVKATANKIQNYVANTTPKEFAKDVGDLGSKIETYENLFGAILTTKGLSTVSKLQSFVSRTVATSWGVAKQSMTLNALKGAEKVASGQKLYRIGTTGKSAQGSAAQFWSLENPLLDIEGYAKKYNVPVDNIKNADFIEIATLKKGKKFITREAGAAPGSANTGKGIEAVIEPGGTTNNVINKIKK